MKILRRRSACRHRLLWRYQKPQVLIGHRRFARDLLLWSTRRFHYWNCPKIGVACAFWSRFARIYRVRSFSSSRLHGILVYYCASSVSRVFASYQNFISGYVILDGYRSQSRQSSYPVSWFLNHFTLRLFSPDSVELAGRSRTMAYFWEIDLWQENSCVLVQRTRGVRITLRSYFNANQKLTYFNPKNE